MNLSLVRTARFVLGALTFTFALTVMFTLMGCRERIHASPDAATDYMALDRPAPADSAAVPLALDFSATGCGSFDPTLPRCSGEAPLTLAFTPVASAELTQFLWTFGDDTADSAERSPVHTYSLPGDYRVTLVGLSPRSGSIQQSHAAFVHVSSARPGAVCDVDGQCADGTTCWCGSDSPCSTSFTRGFCSLPCDADATCPSDAICVDLSASAPEATMDPRDAWRASLCLPECSSDGDCGPGFRCRNLRAGGGDVGWRRACFGSYPYEIGTRCADVEGHPVDSDCASRLCADLGAFRRCAADCTSTPCPGGTGCAHFGNGQWLCLAPCGSSAGSGIDASSAEAKDARNGGGGDAHDGNPGAVTLVTTACDDDPLLACQAPGGTGALGFTVPGALVGTTYCSPKRCTTAADCAPSGVCPSGGGHCQRAGEAP